MPWEIRNAKGEILATGLPDRPVVLPSKDEPGKWDIANEQGVRWSVGMRERPTVSQIAASSSACLLATIASVVIGILLLAALCGLASLTYRLHADR